MTTAGILEKRILFFILVVSVVFAFPKLAYSDPEPVYVAGNPDLYPFEYYNDDSERYEGLMPDIYEVVAKKTGHKFKYINPGKNNEQKRLVKNSQVDLVSAYHDGDIDEKNIKDPIAISDGKTSIYIAFSKNASEDIVADITEAIGDISSEEMLSMIASNTHKIKETEKDNSQFAVLIVVVIALIALIVGIYLRHRRKKQNFMNRMMNSEFNIGNEEYYKYCFRNRMTNKGKALYYVTYIAFDEKEFSKKWGEEESKNIQRYVIEFLNRHTFDVEFFAMLNNGEYAFVFQASNKNNAEFRIREVMKELNLYLSNIDSEYKELFRAGVCCMEENLDCTQENAIYNAKQGYHIAEKNRLEFSFSSKELIEEAHRNEKLRSQLLRAIDKGDFVIYMQFIVNQDGVIMGAEAMSRWHHTQEGLLTPSKYIGMINESDAISMHDLYIFSLVCKQLEEWGNTDKSELFLSCNFTRYSFASVNFFDKLQEVGNQYDFDHSRLIIEITEDSLSADPEMLSDNIRKIKMWGARIAIDDMGSGYTTLSDLYNFNIDIVKLEREMVLQAMEERGKKLLDGIIDLVHNMGIEVLCEGIETEEQVGMIHETDCEYIQGFYYSTVLPVREAVQFLENVKYAKKDKRD